MRIHGMLKQDEQALQKALQAKKEDPSYIRAGAAQPRRRARQPAALRRGGDLVREGA